MSFGNYKDDNTSNNNNRLESLEAKTDFPSVLVNWLKSNKETATDDEEQNIFVEESFIVSQTREEEEEDCTNITKRFSEEGEAVEPPDENGLGL